MSLNIFQYCKGDIFLSTPNILLENSHRFHIPEVKVFTPYRTKTTLSRNASALTLTHNVLTKQ